MMKQKYKLYLMGEKEPLELDQEPGQKLSILLMEPNSIKPKFIFLFGDIISTSSIRHLAVEEYFVKVDEYVPLTQSELETLEKYNQMKEKLTQKIELKELK